MENPEIVPFDGSEGPVGCSNCKSHIGPEEVFCSNCGFPENGNGEDKAHFSRKVAAKKKLLKEVKREVRKGKTTLIVLGVVNALSGIYFGFVMEDVASAVVQIILAVVYLGLSVWTDKQPFGALLSALILYLSLVLLMAVLEPVTLFSGLLWKILIIGFLIRGIKSGHQARNIYRELEDLGMKTS